MPGDSAVILTSLSCTFTEAGPSLELVPFVQSKIPFINVPRWEDCQQLCTQGATQGACGLA